MKRIFKLRGEILLFAILSIIIGWILTIFGENILHGQGLIGEINFSKCQKENEKIVESVKRRLDIESGDKDLVCEKLDEMKEKFDTMMISKIYIVDNTGKVIKSGVDNGIKSFDLSNNSMNIEKKYYYINNVIKINDNYSVVYVNNGWGDDGDKAFWVCIVVIIIIFLLFLRGRVKYIKVIADKINKIALGDFKSQVPVKYRNELTDLASNINTMAKDLDEMDNNQKEFITNISHDLRTPLTTIVGYSKMIADKDYDSEEELQKYINIIRRKSLYLSSMIDDFFDYAKISSQDIEHESIKINFNEMLNQLLYGEELNLKKRNLKMTTDLCQETLYVKADPMLLGRAIQNLISNSLKYTKQNGQIKMKLSKEKSNLCFSIYNDTENEIEKEDVDKLFKRLYKIDKSRGDKGSGLGLVITKEIIEVFEGNISAETEKTGIKFIIKLPLIS